MRLPFLSPPRAAPRLQAGDVVEVAGARVRLSVNARARRVGLRVSRIGREVVATAPTRARLPEALAFAHARAAWIAERLAELPEPCGFAPGVLIPVRGAPCRLERAGMRVAGALRPASQGEPQRLVASGEGAAFSRAVERVLRREALAELTGKTHALAARLGEAAPVVSVADARGRWGSCRPASRVAPARIRYTWRLVCAPTAVLDYVAAHEAAHLREPNHGAGFWALNRELYAGDLTAPRAWLRMHGASLHALGGEG